MRFLYLMEKEAYFIGSVDLNLNIENVVKIYFFIGYLLALHTPIQKGSAVHIAAMGGKNVYIQAFAIETSLIR